MNTIFESPVDLSIFKPYQTDCKKCCGLCCVALYFAKSDGFPDNKEAGMLCKNLLPDFKCKVHSALFRQGLKGCMAYDCFGAGQYVTSLLKKRPNWNALTKEESNPIFDSFITVLKMHQTLWYLSQCLFLTQPQINGAKGNKNTILPPYLFRPQTWDFN